MKNYFAASALRAVPSKQKNAPIQNSGIQSGARDFKKGFRSIFLRRRESSRSRRESGWTAADSID
jgi:hypothetical protein